jgi:hypothetical protein
MPDATPPSSLVEPRQKGREQLPDQWSVSGEQLRSTLVGDGLEGLLDSCLRQALVQVPGLQDKYPGFRMASPRCAGLVGGTRRPWKRPPRRCSVRQDDTKAQMARATSVHENVGVVARS